jgi:hypothetical protein
MIQEATTQRVPISRVLCEKCTLQAMSQADLDQLRLTYKQATDEWVAAIRAEEALATPDHSMLAWEKWDDAHFREHDAHTKFTETREAYKDALRAINIGI